MRPAIGDWYRAGDEGQKFEIVDVKDDEEIVEVQYHDGTVEHLDLEEMLEDMNSGVIVKATTPSEFDYESDDDDGEIDPEYDNPEDEE